MALKKDAAALLMPLHLFLLFMITIMPTNLRTSPGFGAPENFSMAKLPTYAAVGRQFLQCQSDLKASRNKLIVPNHDVAQLVNRYFCYMRPCICM